MILSAFTLIHVVISLIAIGSGFAVVSGLIASKPPDGSTTLFWTTAVATTVTGFLFPFHGFTVKLIEEHLNRCKIPIAAQGVRAKWQPKPAELAECEKLGRAMGQAVKTG